MRRQILVGGLGLVLATLLIFAGGTLLLRSSGVEALMIEALQSGDEAAARRAVAGGRDPAATLETVARGMEFGVFPSAMVAAGVFVGAFARRRPWLVVALALAPLLFAFVAGRSFSVSASGIAAFYMLLACGAAAATTLTRQKMAAG